MQRLATGFVGAMALMMMACGGEAAQSTEQAGEAAPAPSAAPATAMPAMELPAGVTAEMVAQGEQIYGGQGLCFSCHGADGKGTALAPDLTDDQWLNVSGHNYEEIVGVITNGVAQPRQYPSPMIARAGANLTDEQVRAVAAYVFAMAAH